MVNINLYWMLVLKFTYSKAEKIDSVSIKLNFKILQCFQINSLYHDLSHVMRKPVFGICDYVRLKPACSAAETI